MENNYKQAYNQGIEEYFNLLETGTKKQIETQSKLNKLLSDKVTQHKLCSKKQF